MMRRLLFLIAVVATLLSSKAVAQTWIFQTSNYSNCGNMTFVLYDTKGTATETDDVSIATVAHSSSADWPTPLSRSQITLPSGTDATRIRITGQVSCDTQPYNQSISWAETTGLNFYTIVPGSDGISGNWESAGQLYRFTNPQKTENCDVVNVYLPDYLYHGGPAISPTVTWVITGSPGTHTIFDGGSSVSITTANMKSWFGNFPLNTVFTATPTDGTFGMSPVTFRMRSPRPQVDFNSVSTVCTTSGRFDVKPGAVISTDVPQVLISHTEAGHPRTEAINLPLINSADIGSVSIPLPAGMYDFQIRNYDASDTSNSCFTKYYLSEGNQKVIADASYSLTFGTFIVHETCQGPARTGSISLTGLNGVSPYSYVWKKDPSTAPFSTASSLTGLAGDTTYRVTVTDGKGCTGSSGGILVEEPDAITASAAPGDVSCKLSTQGTHNDGTITFIASGGSAGNFQYSADNGANYQDGNVIYSRTEGTYHIWVRDRDRQSCTKYLGTINVGAPDAVSIAANSLEVINPDCSYELGYFKVAGDGGVGPYTYSLNNTALASYSTTNEFDVPGSPGTGTTHIIRIRDSKGCILPVSRSIKAPVPLSFDVTIKPQSCPAIVDGKILVRGHGGTGPQEFSLDYGDFVPEGSPTVFDELITKNGYRIDLIDSLECVADTTVNVSIKPALEGIIEIMDSISCYGEKDGRLQLTQLQGGTPPYNYLWSNDSTGISISNIGEGHYEATLEDSVGCKLENISFDLGQPGLLSLTDSLSFYSGYEISCKNASDASVYLTIEGGTSPYAFAWTDALSYTNAVKNPTGMPPGNYRVVVTDHHACKDTISNILITEPPALTLDLSSKKDIRCWEGSDGAIRVIPGGGVFQEPYEYSVNTVDWQDSVQFLGLPADDYIVYIRDANMCIDTLAVSLTQPDELVLSLVDTTNTICGYNNGAAIVNAADGSPGYTFSWYDEASAPFGSGPSLTNLSAGVYLAVVRDTHDCLDSLDVFIENSNGPQIALLNSQVPRCHDTDDGIIEIGITQGIAPYTIQWRRNGQVVPAYTAELIQNLPGDTYTARVTDTDGCMDFHTESIPAPLPLSVTEQVIQPTCVGSSDGSIALTAAGGNGSYTYSWTHGPINQSLVGLPMGTYTVTIHDAKLCSLQHINILSDPPPTTVDIGEDRTICVGQQVRISPGLPGTYAWTADNGFTSSLAEVVLTEPGLYRVLYTTPVGCNAEDEMVIITSTDLLQADFLMIDQAHAGDTVMVIDISWPIPDNISWNFPEGVTTLTNDGPFAEVIFEEPGEYTITLDANIGECVDEFVKLITILEERSETGGRTRSEGDFIRSVEISPNINHGVFSVFVDLREEAEVYAAVVTQDGSRIVYSLRDTGSDHYQWDVNLPPVSSGMYYLLVRAGNKVKVVRMIKI